MLFTIYFLTAMTSISGCLLYDVFNGERKRNKKTPRDYISSFFRKFPRVSLNLTLVTFPVFYLYDVFLFDKNNPCTLHPFLIFFISFLFTDFFFYVMHYLFHCKIPILNLNMYEFHKIHHEDLFTTGITTFYAHPIDYLFGNLIPMSLPIALLNPKPSLTVIMIIFGILKSVIWGHGDYNFTNKFHENHHLLFNKNYGSSRLFDYIFGTLKIE